LQVVELLYDLDYGGIALLNHWLLNNSLLELYGAFLSLWVILLFGFYLVFLLLVLLTSFPVLLLGIQPLFDQRNGVHNEEK
jgi:hypothetical protein